MLSSTRILLGLTGVSHVMTGEEVYQRHSGCDLLGYPLAGSLAFAEKLTINCSKVINPMIATSNEATVPKHSECQFGLWDGPPAM